jgi:succinyl-CoA synthetase beta subunit
MMVSKEGGMDIEEVAEHRPEAIIRMSVDPVTGLMPYQARELAFALDIPAELLGKATKFFMGLYQAYVDKDCSIAEINPLVVTNQGDLICLDAKMNFDSNALYRQKDIVSYRDLNEEEPTEIEASKYELAFIKLDGNIGCLVNGAGLAMATLDIIKLHGGTPANFLDVGGGANKEKVTAAFRIILNDPKVKAILVNIFGGIMRCDVIAEGVIAAAKEVGLKVPLVVRLQGTNVELGKKILAESGINVISADTLTEAADRVVKAAGK